MPRLREPGQQQRPDLPYCGRPLATSFRPSLVKAKGYGSMLLLAFPTMVFLAYVLLSLRPSGPATLEPVGAVVLSTESTPTPNPDAALAALAANGAELARQAPASVLVGHDAIDYVPPTEPRTESAYGALYRELRDNDEAAVKLADRLWPWALFPDSPEARQAEDARHIRWMATYGEEWRSRLAMIATRERLPIEELIDIKAEGNCRAWFASQMKRARLGRSEDQIQGLLKIDREYPFR
jgi:hypothetical protein